MNILVPYVGEQMCAFLLGIHLGVRLSGHWTCMCLSLSSYGKSVFQNDCKELGHIWLRQDQSDVLIHWRWE